MLFRSVDLAGLLLGCCRFACGGVQAVADGISIGEASATIVIQRQPQQRCVGVDTIVPNVAVASMG